MYLSIRPLNVNGIGGIGGEWVGLACLVKVERIGTRAGKPYQQLAYDISSKCFDAAQFAQGIRGHWGIENRLHWVKDKYLDRINLIFCQARHQPGISPQSARHQPAISRKWGIGK